MKALIKSLPAGRENYAFGATLDHGLVQNQLIDSLGYYCSYCEMPLGGYEIVHHKYFKAWQPQIKAEDLEHLLLICKDCRDHISKEVLSQEEHDNMLWPDKDVTFALHPKSPFYYERRSVRHLVLDGDAIHADEYKNLVFIVPNPLAGEELYYKAKNTIDHFQLNMKKAYYNETSGTAVITLQDYEQHIDNRIFERTRAWEEAEAALDRIRQIKAHPDFDKFPQLRDMLYDQISASAYFKGNWSVWMTVFNASSGIQSDSGPEAKRNPLLNLFIKDERYFKGIDLEKLGLQL